MLVLTDHRTHSAENSIYALAKALRAHPLCARLDIASRGNPQNEAFFNANLPQALFASPVYSNFRYTAEGHCYKIRQRLVTLREYDIILMRLPHPVEQQFWQFIITIYPEKQIINQPTGIHQTGSKDFLLNFQELCPPMLLCQTIHDIEDFKRQFPIVLKPLRNYGGKGVVKIANNEVWEGNSRTTFIKFAQALSQTPIEYLGMKFLPNVNQGDKRIVVCNKELLGASVRLPVLGSWLCNAAQGGHAVRADITEEETFIAQKLNAVLHSKGIILYGFDTLVNDDGKRVLSEINTTSIGGLPQIAKLNGKPIVSQTADLLWNYVKNEVYGESPVVA